MSDTFELDPDTARVVLTIGEGWLPGFAGIPGAVFLRVTSFECRRTGRLPTWPSRAGLVLTPLVCLGYPAFGFNAFLVIVWILVVYTAEPGSPSEQALRILASSAANEHEPARSLTD